MDAPYAPHGAIETPTAPLHDPALMAAAGFLAGYSGTTNVGYRIDLRHYWEWCEANGLHVFDARRPHVELYVRSLEETRSATQQITILGAPDEGTFTLTYRRATTVAIAHDAITIDVQTALEGLSTIGKGNVAVEVGPTPGIWIVTFTGQLANRAASTLQATATGDLDVTIDTLQTGRAAYARTTIGRRLSTVCSFYKWCADEDLIAKNPAANVRRPRISQDSTTLGLDREELGRFLVQAGLSNPRDHALACLLALNGLRVNEACNADIDNIRWERGHRTILVERKGGKRAVIPLAPRTSRAVDLAIGERTGGPILTGRHGRLTRFEAYRIVRRLGRKAGILHAVHPHCCRHAFITAALDAGVPLRDVQEAASHSDRPRRWQRCRHRVSLDRHAAPVQLGRHQTPLCTTIRRRHHPPSRGRHHRPQRRRRRPRRQYHGATHQRQRRLGGHHQRTQPRPLSRARRTRRRRNAQPRRRPPLRSRRPRKRRQALGATRLTRPTTPLPPSGTLAPMAWTNSTRNGRRHASGWAEQRHHQRIIERDAGICYLCHEPGADTVDHIIPLARGGTSHDDNLAATHAVPCHRDKTHRERKRPESLRRPPEKHPGLV